MADEDRNRNKSDPQPHPSSSYPEKGEGMKLWGILIFGVIGATATTLAVTQLGRTVDWFYLQLTRSASSWKGGKSGSFRSAFQEEARRRYNRRMQEEYEEEMERVERIRRMQSVFNRERNKYKRSYESWKDSGQGAYHQHFQRDDWYWKADPSFRDHSKNFRRPPIDNIPPLMSHHYLVLGLDRSRTTAYTDAEIKTAFRKKAKQFHPDQNQNDKEAAEAKFKQVMTSYEAIKEERKNMR
ncbi:Chaperone protein DnaJ [Linum grandiflorum]